MNKKYPEPIAGTLIHNDRGEILLIFSPKWAVDYSIPGGHVELGETIEDAAKREAKEEVGLNVEFEKVLFVQEAIFPKEYHKKKHFIFLECLCKAKNSNIELDNIEAKKFIWVKPEKTMRLNIDVYTRRLIKKYLEYKNDKQS